MYRKIIISIIILIIPFSIMKAEDKPLYYLGAYGSLNLNKHIADFQKLGNYPNCCQKFKFGDGTGFSFGGLFEIELKKVIFFGTRIGFSSLGATLERQETIGNAQRFLSNGDTIVAYAKTKHSLDSKLFTINIETYINYKFFGVLNSYIGVNIAYLMTAQFSQKEELLEPDNATFLDGRVIQNDYSNKEIPNKSTLLFFGVFGLGYDLPIGGGALLTPEIKYYLPINNISDVSWKTSSWQFGAALKFPIYPPKVLPVIRDTIFVRDTNVVAILNLEKENIKLVSRNLKYKKIEEDDVIIDRTIINENYEKQVPKYVNLEASITVTGIKEDGTKIKNPVITVEETEVEQGFPLLPYVFFKKGSSALRQSSMNLLSKDETLNFSEDSLPRNTLKIYSNLLNIIGERLRKNPNTSITIVGCNNDLEEEANNLYLSKQRALAIKDYLTNVWGISQNRLKIKSRNLPANPSNNDVPDGIQENQRAEIVTKYNDLIKPLNLKDIERTSDPPILSINPTVNAEAGLKDWQIDVKQDNALLRHFEGENQINEIIWQIEKDPMPKVEKPLNISLDVKDDANQEKKIEKNVDLKLLTIKKKRYELKDDKRIERFSLIVFDFNKADIKPYHKKILQEIKSHILPNSKVTISGYTDRTGESEYNLELAKRRVLEVQKILKVKSENLTINPVGSNKLLYNNDIPEGRSYSRTVQIVIETPIEKK